MNYDPNNIFAKIIKGELPCCKVLETETTIAFMDLMPQSKGHVLVLPKEPAMDLFDISASSLSDVIKDVQIVARACKEALQADGVSIFQFSGEASGQTVFHFHFHVVPRYEGEIMHYHATQPEELDVLNEQARLIREALKILPSK